MAITYRIDGDHRLVIAHVRGELTHSEARVHQEELRNDAGFDSSFNGLIELSEVPLVAMTNEEIRSIAEHNPFSRTSRVAVFAPESVVFGLSRMFQAFNEYSPAASQVAVFYDPQSAFRFLASGEME